MQANSSSAFFLSATLHGVIVGLILLMTFAWQGEIKDPPKIFELVAGEGDNYMATAAPALGREGGIKVPLTEAPAPRPLPPAPAPIESVPEPVVEAAPVKPAAITPAPVTPAPKAAVVAKAPPDAIRDFSKDVKRISKKREDRLVAKDRAAREAAEKKARLEEAKQKKMTKEEFDRQNKAGVSAKGGSPTKVARVDAEGIAKGVIGGNAANKVGGAGGPALTRDEGDQVDLYAALLGRKIKEALDERPGVGAGLIVEVEIRILADGTLLGFRILKSSGSLDFDQAVREAFTTIRMPKRPKGLSEVQRIPIRGVD